MYLFTIVNKQAPKYLDNMFIPRNVSRYLRLIRDAITVFMETRSRYKWYDDRALKSMAQNFGTNYPYI